MSCSSEACVAFPRAEGRCLGPSGRPFPERLTSGLGRLAGTQLRWASARFSGSRVDFPTPIAVDEAGEQRSRAWSPPPGCLRHPTSHVVRNGTYGVRTPQPRQLYLCRHSTGAGPTRSRRRSPAITCTSTRARRGGRHAELSAGGRGQRGGVWAGGLGPRPWRWRGQYLSWARHRRGAAGRSWCAGAHATAAR